MARRSKRKNVLDWWQTILDETKDLVDDGIDRLRDDDDDDERLSKEVSDLRRSIVDLSAKLDALEAASRQPAAKTTP
jgi:gas vesicle protein